MPNNDIARDDGAPEVGNNSVLIFISKHDFPDARGVIYKQADTHYATCHRVQCTFVIAWFESGSFDVDHDHAVYAITRCSLRNSHCVIHSSFSSLAPRPALYL